MTLDFHRQVSMLSAAKLLVRVGAGLILLVLVWSCATIPGLDEEAVGTYIRVPFVRVLLQEGADEVMIGADASFAIECLSQGQQAVYHSGQAVTVAVRGRALTVTDRKGNVIESSLDEINIIPRGSGNRVRVGNRRYRGIVKALPHGHNIRLVNLVYMEDYLRGVVPPEIGRRTEEELEAVKAQVIAARTYAMAHLKQYRAEPFDMKSSVIDQIYEGVDVEDPLVSRAIEKTAGKVAAYQDEFINAYYHSTCGGTTDNIADVWDRKEVPYLKSVEDGTACSWSKYYTWKEVFTEAQLRGRIEQYLSSDRGRDLRIGTVTDVVIKQRTPGGRIAKLIIHTDGDTYAFYKDRIRWVIRRASDPELILPSDRFDLTIARDPQGNINTVTFDGRGYGHGVGMCQCGAIGRARAGWTCEQILTHYYTDVAIKKLY